MRDINVNINLGLDITKEFRKIVEDIFEKLDGTKDKRALGLALLAIAKLLRKAEEKIGRHEIPKEESHELIFLIRTARRHSDRIKKKAPVDVAYILEEAIPEVGRLLRQADFFI